MDLQLANQLAVVTGSTAGIGKAIARQLLCEGARVVVNGRTQPRVDAAVSELRSCGDVHGFAADLADANACAAFVKQVKGIGTPDIVVANMGVYRPTPFFDAADEIWSELFNANVLSTVRVVRGFFNEMLARGHGRVIIIASETALKPNPEMIPYAISKAAQITLARGLAEMTKGTAVTVNSVLVAATMTEGQNQMLSGIAKPGEAVDVVAQNRFVKNNATSLLQRYALPQEVADIVVFLASSRAICINGTAQRADGGLIRATH